jgi:hypothetical protein
MAITAPINTEIISTNGIESIPNLDISAVVRRKNTFHLSGIANTRLINKQYLPKVSKELVKNIFYRIFNNQRQSYAIFYQYKHRLEPLVL